MPLPQLRLGWLCEEGNAHYSVISFLSSHYLCCCSWHCGKSSPCSLPLLSRFVFQSHNCVVQLFLKLNLDSLSTSGLPSQALHPCLPSCSGTGGKGGAGLCQLAQIWLLNLPWSHICPKRQFWGDGPILSSPAEMRADSSSQPWSEVSCRMRWTRSCCEPGMASPSLISSLDNLSWKVQQPKPTQPIFFSHNLWSNDLWY